MYRFSAQIGQSPRRVSATEEPESPQEGTGGAEPALSRRVPHLSRSLGTHSVHGGCEHTMLQQHCRSRPASVAHAPGAVRSFPAMASRFMSPASHGFPASTRRQRRRGDDCQWQPKTAHLWQPKTAHFWGGRLGRSGHSPGDARRACWAGRRERSDRSPGQHAPRSCGAGDHVATPSRCSSDAVLSQC